MTCYSAGAYNYLVSWCLYKPGCCIEKGKIRQTGNRQGDCLHEKQGAIWGLSYILTFENNWFLGY